jgi:hypothetical protein
MLNGELGIEERGSRAQHDLLNSQFTILNLGAALLLLLGHFLPWAAHPTSALTQSGHELAFSTNFTPGAGVFANEWFFVTVWCSALLLASALSQSERVLPRIVFGGMALVIASLGFPPYPQVLTAFRAPDYQVQFFISLLVMVGVVALVLMPAKRMPAVTPVIVLLACGVLSLAPVVGFLAMKPAIESLYGGPVGLGLGWWLTLAAALAALVMAMVAGAKMRKSSRQ